MKRLIFLPLLLAAAPAVETPKLAPSEIVAAAPAADWVAIALTDLRVMDLPPLGEKPRRVVIQLMPPPFSQGWVGNIRKLAAARWWDGTSVNRVQDNYVVQWGDASEKKPLPAGLAAVPERDYQTTPDAISDANVEVINGKNLEEGLAQAKSRADELERYAQIAIAGSRTDDAPLGWHERDSVAKNVEIYKGWPLASDGEKMWPTHCYGMVGVGRGMPPDTGSGAELYTVIGHAPRHLDRNIALVGRVIEGMEHLSSLPRGTGTLGFYEKVEERVPIVSVRLGNEVKDLPRFEYLSTESESFARYADARANRRDEFFIKPADGADICNIPVPVRRAKG